MHSLIAGENYFGFLVVDVTFGVTAQFTDLNFFDSYNFCKIRKTKCETKKNARINERHLSFMVKK